MGRKPNRTPSSKVKKEKMVDQDEQPANGVLPAPDQDAAPAETGEKETQQTQPEASESQGGDSKADKYHCPLTKEVMQEPVVLESGVVYDKAAITKHLATGNHTCPVTGQNVRPDVLVPLPSLKKEIAERESGAPEQDTLVEALTQLDTITQTLSKHLQAAEQLSRALSSRVSTSGDGDNAPAPTAQQEHPADSEPVDVHEITAQVRELAKQVSKLGDAATSPGKRNFFRAIADGLSHAAQAARRAVSDVATAVQSHTGPVLAQVAHHVTVVSQQVTHHVSLAGQHVAYHVSQAGQHAAHHVAAVSHGIAVHAGPVVELVARNVGATGHNVARHVAAVGEQVVHHAGPVVHTVAKHSRHAAGAARDGAVLTAVTVRRAAGEVGGAVRGVAGDAAGAVGHHVGPLASKAKQGLANAGNTIHVQGQRVGGAVQAQLSPVTTALGRWWTALSPERQGMIKATVLLLGVNLLLRKPRRPTEGEATSVRDVGELLRQLQAAVLLKVQEVAQQLETKDKSGTPGSAKQKGRKVAKIGNAADQGSRGDKQGGAKSRKSGNEVAEAQQGGAVIDRKLQEAAAAVQKAAGGVAESLQHTGAAALGALQHAVDGVQQGVSALTARSRGKKYLVA